SPSRRTGRGPTPPPARSFATVRVASPPSVSRARAPPTGADDVAPSTRARPARGPLRRGRPHLGLHDASRRRSLRRGARAPGRAARERGADAVSRLPVELRTGGALPARRAVQAARHLARAV